MKNSIKNYFGHSIYRCCRWSFKMILCCLLCISASFGTQAQGNFCCFDEDMDLMIQQDPPMLQMFNYNNTAMQNMMNSNPQAIMNNNVYTIPVVFHIIHLGEPEGVGTNINGSYIYQALQDLNDDFRDVNSVGYDVEIEFCLAQQDPAGNSHFDGSGNNITGIQRANGNGVGNYQNIGLAMGSNEIQVKALSNWPNTDYVNIWVVHTIAGPAIGFATFPGANDNVDGIVLEIAAVGTPAYSRVIAHEGGHFFNLFHTFQGANTTTCPPNTNCATEGDRVCDTRPHLTFGSTPYPCDENQYLTCDNSTYNDLVVENHMNYTDNSCRDEFTSDQAMRMRCALMMLRSQLMFSIGCQPACVSTVADFDVIGNTTVPNGTTVHFTNTSSNATSYEWSIDGVVIATNTDFSHQFLEGGIYNVCLTAFGPGCVIKKCVEIIAYPVCQLTSPCEKVLNGDFEQITGPTGSSLNFDNVCGWDKTYSSPFYCSLPDNNSVGLYFYQSDEERITSEVPLDLQVGQTYCFCFDYFVSRTSVAAILVSLTSDNNFEPLPGNATNIAFIPNPGVNGEVINNHSCYNNGYFNTYCSSFTYNGNGDTYLNVSGISTAGVTDYSLVFVDNISINDCGTCGCIAIPDFEIEIDSCSVTFMGVNTGDPGDFEWNFGDGSTGTGDTIVHDYIYGDTITVCLTVSCDLETSATICKDVIIPEYCDDCEEEVIEIAATQCEPLESGEDRYISNFTFDVPNGFQPCIGDDFYINSSGANITVTSYTVDTSGVNTDSYDVAIIIAPPLGSDFELNGIEGHITLCGPDGEMICYTFVASGSTCDDCLDLDLQSDAICIDSEPNDSIFVYGGDIEITLPAGNYQPCGFTSTEAGYDHIMVSNGTGNGFSIQYTITTTTTGSFSASTLLCFKDEEGNKVCVTLNITIGVPCFDPPENCVKKWATKSMSCKGTENGYAIFNFTMNLQNGGYELCGDELFGTIEGDGYVQVNSASTPGSSFNFDVDIYVPCGFDASGVYELRLYLCDEEGNVVCYAFPFKFSCSQECDPEIGDGTGDGDGFGDGIVIGGGGGANGSKGKVKSAWGADALIDSYTLYPNPAKDQLTVLAQTEDVVRLIISDHSGRVVHQSWVSGGRHQLDISAFHSGLYMVRILNRGVPDYTNKLIIIK